jgi:hypothetical protein
MQEASQYEVDADRLQFNDPLGDLLRCANQIRAKAIVVLDRS